MRRAGGVGLSFLSLAAFFDTRSGLLSPNTNPKSLDSSTTPTDSFNSNWGLANPRGIYNPNAQQWTAGHVNDVLEISPTSVLVATQTGGVWLLTTASGASLSMDWDAPNVTCLAQGGDGVHHFYAGGVVNPDGILFNSSQGSLYVTDPSASEPLLAPWHAISLPGIGPVLQIVIDILLRRIILATETGIYWSYIPANPISDTYVWRSALGLPNPKGAFSGLALTTTPDNHIITIAAAAWGADVASGHYGFFYGQWQGPDLVMQRATIRTGADPNRLGFTRLASPRDYSAALYALSAESDVRGRFGALLLSGDGGQNWLEQKAALVGNATSNLVHDVAGEQGDGWNNALGVSPTDPNILAIGWQYGPFLSTDAGNSFVQLPGVHDDHHVIRFTSTNGTTRLYDGSDGGIFVSTDMGRTFASGYNSHLANLQFYGPTAARQEWGRMTASYQFSGLIGGGLQDNANVYCITNAQNSSVWHQLDWKADGGAMTFLRTGGLLHNNNGGTTRYAQWDGRQLIGDSEVPIRQARSGATNAGQGIAGLAEIVNDPVYQRNGQLMYAVCADNSPLQSGLPPDIYGLFGNSNGSDMHWDYLTSLPPNTRNGVSAIGSGSGAQVFVGLSGNGQIFLFNPANSFPPLPSSNLPIDKSRSITRIIVQGDGNAIDVFALINDATGGSIYRTSDGQNWNRVTATNLPSEMLYCIETDWTVLPKTLFVATDDKVYASRDNGNSWEDISTGLPKRPHCSDIDFVQQADGIRYLYLATFGWSVWRTRLL